MKEFLQSIFKSTAERIRNPFVGSFMTSWILFNWKPILFIVLSSQKIEDKIRYVEKEYTNYLLIIWFPLAAAIFYILVLPYLNLLFDEILKYSLLKRNILTIGKQKQIIDNQKQLAIEEIKLEEAKTEFRERNTHNKLVEDLQNKSKSLENEFQLERERNQILVEQSKNELSKREKLANEEVRNFEKRYLESREEIMELNNKIFEKDRQLQDFKMHIGEQELNNIERPSKNTLIFKNGLKIIERFDGNNVIYFNDETQERYSEKEVSLLMEKYEFERRKR